MCLIVAAPLASDINWVFFVFLFFFCYSANQSTRFLACTSSTRLSGSRDTSLAQRKTFSLHASAKTSSWRSSTFTAALQTTRSERFRELFLHRDLMLNDSQIQQLTELARVWPCLTQFYYHLRGHITLLPLFTVVLCCCRCVASFRVKSCGFSTCGRRMLFSRVTSFNLCWTWQRGYLPRVSPPLCRAALHRSTTPHLVSQRTCKCLNNWKITVGVTLGLGD